MPTRIFAFAYFAAALGLLSPAASDGEELRVGVAKSVILDSLIGTLYFTSRNGEYALVATFDEERHPVRVVANLQRGQEVELLSPRGFGKPASVLEIRRVADRVVYEILPGSRDPASSPGELDLVSGP